MVENDELISFKKLLAEELNCLRQRRNHVRKLEQPSAKDTAAPSVDDEKAEQTAVQMDLIGLALSGGGIRSATFNLGVLQGLAHLGLLRRFDYLSTVSGGGYIGTWLAAWIKREGNPLSVEQQLKPNRETQARAPATRLLAQDMAVEEEPEPIYHLRSYSNYLSPRLGLFSIDTWTLVSIYVRNFLLNLAVLVPLMLALVLLSRLLLCGFYAKPSDSYACVPTTICVLLATGLLVFAFVKLTGVLRNQLQNRSRHPASEDAGGSREVLYGETLSPRRRVARQLQFSVFLPLLIASVFISWLFHGSFTSLLPNDWEVLKQPFLLALTLGIVSGLVLGLARLVVVLFIRGKPKDAQAIKNALRTAFYSALSGLLGGFLYSASFTAGLWNTPQDMQPATALALGPSLLLGVFLLGIVMEIGLHGRKLKEDAREWWGTIGGYLLIYLLGWLAFFAITLFSKPLLEWAGIWVNERLLRTGLAATWITTAVAGALSGRSQKTRNGMGNRRLEWLGAIAPPVFVVGLLVVVSLFASWLVEGEEEDYWLQLQNTKWYWVLLWIVVSALFSLIIGGHGDVNLFSQHGTYANRLIRCYLGASRRKLGWRRRDGDDRLQGTPARLTQPQRRIRSWLPGRGGAPTGNDESQERQADLITGFDPDDDILLSDLVIGKPHEGKKTYWGPFLIINTALNLETGDELAWQERKADSFVLTSLAGGSKTTGYKPLPPYNREQPDQTCDLTVGRAMAISGAAASPNMGYHSSPPLAFLMTIFNVRLGWWMQNPRQPDWLAGSPARWDLILHELLGQANENGRYVYLSDGGHFENLGAYELIRRRCRFIVICDADADPSYDFFDLGNLIRKCRNDFGIRIEIDVAALRPQGADRRSRWHCAIGAIRYDDLNSNFLPGILVYLKSSLTGNEPSDILAYADQFPSFPHQSTSNQFFTESQFESYRALGFHIVQEVFGDVTKSHDIKCNRTTRTEDPATTNRQIFSRLRRRWFPPPPDLEPNFLESVKGFLAVHQALRREESLRDLSRDLYPELVNLLQDQYEGDGVAAGTPPLEMPAGVNPGGDNPGVGNGSEANGDADAWNSRCAELHTVTLMLQVMENAWLGLKLGQYYEHPLNRGWMTVFRRWSNSDAFSRHWPALRGQYSQEFVWFCEKELKLLMWDIRAERLSSQMTSLLDDIENGRIMDGKLSPNDREKTDLANLSKAFAFDWFREDGEERGLPDLMKKALQLSKETEKDPYIWIIRLTNASKEEEKGLGEGNVVYPCGIILLFKPLFLPEKPIAQENKFEFFVWIDGPYRNQSIGRDPDCVQQALTTIRAELKAKLNKQFHLFARYPEEGKSEGNEPLERSLWANFFHYYDFHRAKSEEYGRKQDLIFASGSNEHS